MAGKIQTIDETIALIREGRRLMLAADESVLARLPSGTWIGGTIPYFMGADGGVMSREVVFVDELPEVVSNVRIVTYGPDDLHRIPADEYPNGFSVVILPAMSDVHVRYAAEAPEYPGLFNQPIVGWVVRITPRRPRHSNPDGLRRPERRGDLATRCRAARCTSRRCAGCSGHRESVPPRRWRHALLRRLRIRSIGGLRRRHRHRPGQLPHPDRPRQSVAAGRRRLRYLDQRLDPAHRHRHGHGLVLRSGFQRRRVQLVAPIGDYVGEFEAQLQRDTVSPTFACNCILNYVYSELEGKKTGDIVGPITFGEVAYQLLNQTLVYLVLV